MTTCILCQTETKDFIHPKTKMIYHECPNCRAIFKDQAHWPTQAIEKKRYLEHKNDITQKGYVNFLQNFIDQAIVPYINHGHLLDFGSGPSDVMSVLLKDMGYNVDSYDPFFQPELPENAYDLILAAEVMEHVFQPMDAFNWINAHLKPNGYFSMMTLFYPQNREEFFKWFYIRDATHIVFYTPKTLRYIANKMNWTLIAHNGHRYATFQKK